MIQEGREAERVLDPIVGRRTKPVCVLDSGHLVLAALEPETIAGQFDQRRSAERG